MHPILLGVILHDVGSRREGRDVGIHKQPSYYHVKRRRFYISNSKELHYYLSFIVVMTYLLPKRLACLKQSQLKDSKSIIQMIRTQVTMYL